MDAVKSFSTWAAGRRGIDPDVVQTVADYKSSFCEDPDPRRWQCGDLGMLLVDVLPRKVIADDEWFDSVIPTMRAYVEFLGERKLFLPRSERAAHLLAELDDLACDFASRVNDPGSHGMATSVLSAMSADGHLPTTNDGLQGLMERFNALPFAERDAILNGDPAPERPRAQIPEPPGGHQMPPVRLARVTELAEAAAQSRIIQQLIGLAEWTGTGKPVTATGVLRLAGASQVIDVLELGSATPDPDDDIAADLLEPEDDPAGQEGLFAVDVPAVRLRSARDHIGLHWLWTAAAELGWIVVESHAVVTGPAFTMWRAADPAGRAELWADALDLVVQAGYGLGRERGMRLRWLDELVDHALIDVLGLLYPGDPEDLDELIDEFMAENTDEDNHLAQVLVPTLLGHQLDVLVELGAVRRNENVITATPLATFAMNRLFTRLGVNAPVVDPGSMTAAQILADPSLVNETGHALIKEWVDVRGAQTAARELLAAGSAGRAADRIAATHLIAAIIGADARPAAAELLEHPLMGPHLRMNTVIGQHEEPADRTLRPEDPVFVAIEGLAAMVWLLEPPVRGDDVPDGAWTLAERLVTTPEIWLHPHPELLEVFDLVGSGHPSGRVRKAAKKAAHKARIARNS